MNPITGGPYSARYMDSVRPAVARLPISRSFEKKRFMEAVSTHDVLIVSAATGAGKTTQIPKFLFEYFGYEDRVVCTQPRRLSCEKTASRVAEELDVELGAHVGFKHGEGSAASAETGLLFTTEGSLRAKMMADPLQEAWRGFIVDEAHERNVDTDIVMLYLERLARARPYTKVVIMTATGEVERFEAYFARAPRDRGALLRVHRMHFEGQASDITVHYAPRDPKRDRVEAACVDRVAAICAEPVARSDHGDVIVFLASLPSIQKAMDIMRARVDAAVGKPFALTGKSSEVDKALHTSPEASNGYASDLGTARKVIFATNVAENSLTISTLAFVVDSGLAMEENYDSRFGLSYLEQSMVSKDHLRQRAGRVGRVSAGTVYREFTKASFDRLPDFSSPQTLCSPTAPRVLDMLVAVRTAAPGWTLRRLREDVLVDLLDPPTAEAQRFTSEYLLAAGFVDAGGALTREGTCASHLTAALKLNLAWSMALVRAVRAAVAPGAPPGAAAALHRVAQQAALLGSDRPLKLNDVMVTDPVTRELDPRAAAVLGDKAATASDADLMRAVLVEFRKHCETERVPLDPFDPLTGLPPPAMEVRVPGLAAEVWVEKNGVSPAAIAQASKRLDNILAALQAGSQFDVPTAESSRAVTFLECASSAGAQPYLASFPEAFHLARWDAARLSHVCRGVRVKFAGRGDDLSGFDFLFSAVERRKDYRVWGVLHKARSVAAAPTTAADQEPCPAAPSPRSTAANQEPCPAAPPPRSTAADQEAAPPPRSTAAEPRKKFQHKGPKGRPVPTRRKKKKQSDD